MATSGIEEHPVQATENEHMELSPEDERPQEKSAVRVNVNALTSPSKFEKGNTVHMSLRSNGKLTKGTFTISKSRYNSQGGYFEYQLKSGKMKELHDGGAWIREKDLGAE